jgi:hypothetical protein
MSDEKQFFWCGWNVPFAAAEHGGGVFPSNMTGWCTGEGGDYETWVGAVWATDAGAAMQTVYSYYGEAANLLSPRWDADPRGTVLKLSDRFGTTPEEFECLKG